MDRMDPQSWTHALLAGLLAGLILFAVLYFGRRLVNRFRRRNADKKPDDVPDEIGWDIDRTDRTYVRIALGSAILTTWLKHYLANKSAVKPYRNLTSDVYPGLETPDVFSAEEWLGPDGAGVAFNSADSSGSLNPNDIYTASSVLGGGLDDERIAEQLSSFLEGR